MTQESNKNKNNTLHQSTDSYYLPDLNNPQAVLGMLLSIELFVGTLALMKYPLGSVEFLNFFAGLSLLMIWIGIIFSIAMQFLRPWLTKLSVVSSTVIQLLCLLIVSVAITAIAKLLLLSYFAQTSFAAALSRSTEYFFINNVFICLIVGGLLLRYFYIAHQNQQRSKAISQAQIQALQSRIRPHFLFNSLNSIASLVRIDPNLAEQAVEDLADLFRASLADETKRVSLKEELEIARLYQRIEQLRLGDRLQVVWNLGQLPLKQKVPVLIVQPLLENAIYHGIEPLTKGGKVRVTADSQGKGNGKSVVICIQNPLAKQESDGSIGTGRKHGNQIAMKNIEQRLRLVYGERAWVKVNKTDDSYEVTLQFPYEDSL